MKGYNDIEAQVGISTRKIGVVVGLIVVVLGTLVTIPKLFENLDAHELMIVQAPWSGELSCYTNPGVKWQGMGRITKYPRRASYEFSDNTENRDTSKKLRFNDGGHANLYGSVNWEMPLDCKSIIELHKTFGSADGVESNGIAKMVDLAVYLSGPLMSSTESSGERRAELVQLINDQAENGVYQTRTKMIDAPDPITGEKKQIAQVEIILDQNGQPKRQQGSILKNFGLVLLPISIKEIRYDSIVEAQITERQKATTQVQIAIANARKAEQDAITIAKQGEATAATARWQQEALKAQAVTAAQQNLEVARLKAQEAEQYKREQILRGEGDAERRRLVMNADGALDQKVEAYIRVQGLWADAFGKYSGQMVPGVIMGGTGASASALGTTQQFLELMTMKAARDLGVDMSVTTGKTTNPPRENR